MRQVGYSPRVARFPCSFNIHKYSQAIPSVGDLNPSCRAALKPVAVPISALCSFLRTSQGQGSWYLHKHHHSWEVNPEFTSMLPSKRWCCATPKFGKYKDHWQIPLADPTVINPTGCGPRGSWDLLSSSCLPRCVSAAICRTSHCSSQPARAWTTPIRAVNSQVRPLKKKHKKTMQNVWSHATGSIRMVTLQDGSLFWPASFFVIFLLSYLGLWGYPSIHRFTIIFPTKIAISGDAPFLGTKTKTFHHIST